MLHSFRMRAISGFVEDHRLRQNRVSALTIQLKNRVDARMRDEYTSDIFWRCSRKGTFSNIIFARFLTEFLISDWLMENMDTVLDGLPYVEEIYGSARCKAQAEALINDELSRSGPFLESHPTLISPPSVKLSPLVQAEFARIQRGQHQSERPKSK